MKKVIVILTSIILCLSISALVYLGIIYSSYLGKYNRKDIKVIEENIKKTEKEIVEGKEEIEKIKTDNKEKVELLEVWKKELNKVKRNS